MGTYFYSRAPALTYFSSKWDDIKYQFTFSIFYITVSCLSTIPIVRPDYLCCLEYKDWLSSCCHSCRDVQTLYNEVETELQKNPKQFTMSQDSFK